MKVSIIIPAYNEEKYIGRTIEALLAQDYTNREIIVVDNASIDKTSEVAGFFPGVIVLREEQKGAHRARETGRQHATGDLIATVDADCMPEKGWLSKGVTFFKVEDVVGLSGPYDYYDTGFVFRLLSMLFQKFFYYTTNLLFRMTREGGVMIGGNMLMRASALRKVGGFDASIVFYGDDTDTAKKLASVGTVVFSPSFIIKSSGRRFRNIGLMRVSYLYFMNFVWVTFLRRPYSKE